MHEEERDKYEDPLLPLTKRKKSSGDASQNEEYLEMSRDPTRSTRTMPEFRAESLDDFYKPCPNYRLPAELGAFSFDEKGTFRLDRSQLRYYNPPSQVSRLSMDLKVGYDGYVPKEKSGSPELGPILRWISVNGNCFRPRCEPLSPNNGTTGDQAASTTALSFDNTRQVSRSDCSILNTCR